MPPPNLLRRAAAECLAAFALHSASSAKPAALGATVPIIEERPALVYEIVLTAVLMFVIVAVATDTRAVGAGAAIAIGGTVALDAPLGGPLTGASMNPAGYFGPVLGAALGASAYRLVRAPQVAS